MMKLEDLKPNATVRGILTDAIATVVAVQWFGSEAVECRRRSRTFGYSYGTGAWPPKGIRGWAQQKAP